MEPGMLRAPVHPVDRARQLPSDAAGDGERSGGDEGQGNGGHSIEELAALVRELADDSLVAEAIAVASPPLAQTVRRVTGPAGCAGDVRAKDLRRAVRALAGYRLRMAARATPFGLMAGVAPVRFAARPDETTARWGAAHRRGVRPDRAWLRGLVHGLERRPAVLRHLRVAVNDLAFVRGDRLVLPYVPQTDAAERDGGPAVQEVSVRCTPAVRAVVDWARTPVRGGELAARLCARFPGVPRQGIEAMLVQLVSRQLLLSELHPPLETADPLAHVGQVLGNVPREDVPEGDALRALGAELAAYAARPVGQGAPAYAAVCARMRELHDGERPLQVDLALDAEVRLPPVVAQEAEAAAGLLWRLSATEPGPAPLRGYHTEFLDRYGTGRLVPVTELLDADTGLGPPAGYRCPPGPRTAPVPAADTERDRALAALAQEALLAGRREVLLDDGHPLLTRFARDEGRPPASAELCAQLLSASPERLAAGDFRLVLVGGSAQAGAMAGRFAYLFPAQARERVRRLARSAGPAPTEALRVQVSVPPGLARGGNVAQVPRWLDALLPVASFPGRAPAEGPGHCDDDPGDRVEPVPATLHDLAVGADAEGLYLLHTATGRRVAPAFFHVLNPQWQAPNAVRFLRDVAECGVRGPAWWDWAGAGVLPCLPRVRYGRTVLAPASWRPDDALRDRQAPYGRWSAALEAWRARLRVPHRIRVGSADRYLELDLHLPAHRSLLRQELVRRPHALVQEAPTEAGCPDGWLSGPDGPHRAEVVLPLVARRPEAAPDPPAVRAPHVRRDDIDAHQPQLPGGDWLFATLHCSAERHDEILAGHLPHLIAALPEPVDRWFFLRYQDVEGPHLRLRFHGPAAALTTQLLPRIHQFAASLRRARLVRRLALDTYDPELERYGGPEAMPAAERVFHTDSLATLEQLSLLRRSPTEPDPLLLVAAGQVAMARAFFRDVPGAGAAGPGWAAWLLGTFGKDPELHRRFRSRLRETLAVIDPGGGRGWPVGAPGGAALREAWARRDEAVAAYGRRLRELGPGAWCTPTGALASLLHLHHNRFAGADRAAERASQAVARAAVQAHVDRIRQGR
ncbi:lantibiotic dehydratase [Streptomyces natalensis]|nr:lantibiotic dehydratase [Streptomyces natalensis]